jgi:hypothetical protein
MGTRRDSSYPISFLILMVFVVCPVTDGGNSRPEIFLAKETKADLVPGDVQNASSVSKKGSIIILLPCHDESGVRITFCRPIIAEKHQFPVIKDRLVGLSLNR